jgi:hypothetical protein
MLFVSLLFDKSHSVLSAFPFIASNSSKKYLPALHSPPTPGNTARVSLGLMSSAENRCEVARMETNPIVSLAARLSVIGDDKPESKSINSDKIRQYVVQIIYQLFAPGVNVNTIQKAERIEATPGLLLCAVCSSPFPPLNVFIVDLYCYFTYQELH